MLSIDLAIGKEFGDSRAQGNHWCRLDLLADALGIIIGTVIHIVIIYTLLRVNQCPSLVDIYTYICVR